MNKEINVSKQLGCTGDGELCLKKPCAVRRLKMREKQNGHDKQFNALCIKFEFEY